MVCTLRTYGIRGPGTHVVGRSKGAPAMLEVAAPATCTGRVLHVQVAKQNERSSILLFLGRLCMITAVHSIDLTDHHGTQYHTTSLACTTALGRVVSSHKR